MIIRAARQADADAMGQLMVATCMEAHRDQLPPESWAKRRAEWTPDHSANGWARTLREIAGGESDDCIYVALDDDGTLLGLTMGGTADAQLEIGAVYALYVDVRHQGRGIGRRLVQTVAAMLAEQGMTALQIGCLSANTPARAFYERMGGRVVAERLFDEDGVLLPEVVYGWTDIELLLPSPR